MSAVDVGFSHVLFALAAPVAYVAMLGQVMPPASAFDVVSAGALLCTALAFGYFKPDMTVVCSGVLAAILYVALSPSLYASYSGSIVAALGAIIGTILAAVLFFGPPVAAVWGIWSGRADSIIGMTLRKWIIRLPVGW